MRHDIARRTQPINVALLQKALEAPRESHLPPHALELTAIAARERIATPRTMDRHAFPAHAILVSNSAGKTTSSTSQSSE